MIIETLPVETLPVGLGAMTIDAVVVHGRTALWAPKYFFEGSLNLIKTSSAHYHTPQSAERRVHPAIGAMPLNHPRRHFFLAIGALRPDATGNLAGRVGCRNRDALQTRGAVPPNHMRRHRDAVRRAIWPFGRVFFIETNP